MNTHKPATPAVLAIGQINFHGNRQCLEWYKHLRFCNGKPDLITATLLADIVWWYTPQEVRDEASGRLIGYSRKFAGEHLQRDPAQYARIIGITERQAKEALYRLDAIYGVIRRIYIKPTSNDTGQFTGTIMYVEPVPEHLREITYNLAPSKVPPAAEPPQEADEPDAETPSDVATSVGENAAPSDVTTSVGYTGPSDVTTSVLLYRDKYNTYKGDQGESVPSPQTQTPPAIEQSTRTTGKSGVREKRQLITRRTRHEGLQGIRALFDLETGRIPKGAGQNGAQVWYEFLSILEQGEYANDIAVDVLMTFDDLTALRAVLMDHMISGDRKLNYVGKIKDWYIKRKAGQPYYTNAATNGGKRQNHVSQQTSDEPDDYVDPQLLARIEAFRAQQQLREV